MKHEGNNYLHQIDSYPTQGDDLFVCPLSVNCDTNHVDHGYSFVNFGGVLDHGGHFLEVTRKETKLKPQVAIPG